MAKQRTLTLYNGLRRNLGVCLPLAKGKSIQKPAKFAGGDGDRSFVAAGPTEGTSLKPTIEQPKAVMIPM